MLHILLVILKIIGIILAAILGILVLLVCIVLFVPIKYKGKADCGGTLEDLFAEARVIWLFRLVSMYICYKDKELHYSWRIAWKRNESEGGDAGEDNFQKETATLGQDEEVEHTAKKLETADEETAETSGFTERVEESREKTPKIDKIKDRNKKSSFLDKIKILWKKIKCTILSIYDRIKLLMEKKEACVEFINDETHKKAYEKVKKETVILLKKWKPKKIEADILFGFEDPYRTGQVLAGLGMIYPFIGKDVSITPDFEHQVFKGQIFIKGKFKASSVASLLWKLVWSKAVRKTYRDIRNFKI